MRKKLTNTAIAKPAVPAGKQSVKLFDTDVGGLGVRKMASGVATFIFEMRPKGAGAMKQFKIGRCGDLSVDQARARGMRRIKRKSQIWIAEDAKRRGRSYLTLKSWSATRT